MLPGMCGSVAMWSKYGWRLKGQVMKQPAIFNRAKLPEDESPPGPVRIVQRALSAMLKRLESAERTLTLIDGREPQMGPQGEIGPIGPQGLQGFPGLDG